MSLSKYRYILENLKGEVRFDEPLSKHTSFRIGGPADALIIPKDISDLQLNISLCNKFGIPWYVIGNGTNVLVSDKGFRGVIIKISNTLNNVTISDTRVTVGAGAFLPSLSKRAANMGLSGLEFGTDIPGTIGGAIRMNAGCGGQDIGGVVEKVRVFREKDGLLMLLKDEIGFGYRDSRFRDGKEIILEAEIKLSHASPEEVLNRMKILYHKRKNSQPSGFPNAGSIFKKPEKGYAGALIEQAGCKGMEIGDARVSEIHANFIINMGNAKFNDIIKLIDEIYRRVHEKFGIRLELEIIILSDKFIRD